MVETSIFGLYWVKYYPKIDVFNHLKNNLELEPF